MKVAARNAFRPATKVVLQKLVKHLRLGVASSASLFVHLKALIAHIFPELNDLDTQEILRLRTNVPEVNRHGLHNVSEALDLLHPSDSKDAVEELDRVDGDADNMDDFQKELKNYVQKTTKRALRARIDGLGTITARRDKSLDEVRKHYHSCWGVALPKDDKFDEATAKRCLPPGAYVYRQVEHTRWAVSHSATTRSRSWALHGYAESFEMVLKWLWRRVLEKDGFDMIDCPLTGLLPARTGNEKRDEVLLSTIEVIP